MSFLVLVAFIGFPAMVGIVLGFVFGDVVFSLLGNILKSFGVSEGTGARKQVGRTLR